MGNVESIEPYVTPIRRDTVVPRSPEEAFRVFTEGISTWWPLGRFSIYQDQAVSCGIEPRQGGMVWERSAGGERATWGTVIVWEPPHRLVVTWHPGREPETAQELEVRFRAVPGGTKVELEHRGWERLGAEAAEARQGYDGGWSVVFDERYVAACQR